MSIATKLADAVADEIGRKTDWSVPITVARTAVPRKEIRDLTEVTVSIIPSSVEYQREARDYLRYTIVVDVGIQKHLDGPEIDAVSELGSLVDEIARYMTGRKLAKMPRVQNVGTSNDPLYIQEHLLQKRVFTSIVSFKYQLIENGEC